MLHDAAFSANTSLEDKIKIINRYRTE